MQTSLTPEGAGLQRPGSAKDALQLQTPDMAPEVTSRAQVSLYQRPFTVTQQGDSICLGEVIPWRGEDLRHASSREDADGFLSQ
jgi:hypothetical protein